MSYRLKPATLYLLILYYDNEVLQREMVGAPLFNNEVIAAISRK